MKTLRYFFLVATMLLVLSCNNSDVSLGSRQAVTFKATLADAQITKTVLQSNGSVFWNPGNAINLFYGDSGSARFEADITSPAAYTNFNGTLDGFTPGGSDYFWAVYPYDSNNEFDGSAITVTLPDEQTAVAGTFADDLFISMARNNDYSLQFYNVCGGVKFSVANEGIKYVVLKGNANEVLAGEVKVGFGSDGKPQVQQVIDGKTEIRLDAPGGGTFEVGQWYYIVALPATFSSGYTMTFYKDAQFAERVTDSSVELKRSVWGKLANADEIDAPAPQYKYLTFTSEGTTWIYLDNIGGNAPLLYYSFDTETWNQWDYSTLTITNDSPLYLCGDNLDGFSYSDGSFSIFRASNDLFGISGDIMSLIDRVNDISEIPQAWCFYNLFSNCSLLTSPPELSATGLTSYCYSHMFEYCYGLVSPPVLPATTLAPGCYYYMFRGCLSLISAPELPATSLAKGCYIGMFEECVSLSSASELPATTLAVECYREMYAWCTGLITPPELLPATILANYCYTSMFQGCTSLTSAPELYANTLADGCCNHMFYGCSSLVSAPSILPATILSSMCYYYMFYGCTSLTIAPELPAIILSSNCYEGMFCDCIGLVVPPALPATSLSLACYKNMFTNCRSLTVAPDLSADILLSDCYYEMFSNCRNLNYVKCLATEIYDSSNSDWLVGVSSTGTFVKAASMEDWPTGPSGIPEGWTVVNDSDTPSGGNEGTSDENWS